MTVNALQNRVQPDGTVVSIRQRGKFFGNRGGKIHDPQSRTLLPKRRWASRQWICCVLKFKSRQRKVMGSGYTELFFLDEITALAAGHRPCFECRRADAVAFAQAWRNDGTREYATQMDEILHKQRLLPGGAKRMHRQKWNELPAGAMIQMDDVWLAKAPSGPLKWSVDGYHAPMSNALSEVDGDVACLTPPAILNALSNGYKPHWHPTAKLD